MENLKNTEFRQDSNLRAKKIGKIHVHYYVIMFAVQIFLLCSSSHPLIDLFSLSCNRAVFWQCLVAPVALLLLLGDKEVLVCSNTFLLGTWIFKVKGTMLFHFLRTQHIFCMFVLCILNL